MLPPPHPQENLASHRLAELVILAFIVLGLSLAILETATGVRWLSDNWATACRRLLHLPAPPSFAGPWRLTSVPHEASCLPRRP